jgi:hypothetical protein
MEEAMRLGGSLAMILTVLLAGCVTPPEIKQALAAKDQAYTDNLALMRQYQTLVENVNERQLHWSRYLKSRELLDLVLKWATTNPSMGLDAQADAQFAEDVSKVLHGGSRLARRAELLEKQKNKQLAADADNLTSTEKRRLQLGDQIIAKLNAVRLDGLPERKGSGGTVIFAKGQTGNDMTKLVQALPELINRVGEAASADYAIVTAQFDYSAFDDYRTNVTALRRLNDMIKRYLDIDVTVKGEDVRELADAVQAAVGRSR